SDLGKPEVAAANERSIDVLREELAEMKEMIRQVAQKPTVVVQESNGESALEAQLRERLSRLGLDRQVITDLINESPSEFRNGNGTLSDWLNYCQQLLAAKLMFSEPLETGLDMKQQVIALIGPTGVGKTTTIAKLAANVNLYERKKVGLITIDTYRIAAVEHLKTYGDIMNLTVEVVYSPADLEQAIANLSECDVILVDTAGRSPRNQAMMEELRKFIAKPVIETILLVISATTQYQDMTVIEQKFSRIAYTHLVFTKLDETSSLGPIVSLAWNCKRPISYLTVGQNVPDDIVVANPDQLIAHLFKGLSHA
ncbi:MAG TPA: flagellar biosynthesis protein FlhF, partial [Bacillota bacterium]|nr:flagellar biosynthesis protein FlhF [Bacillota bacterium]